MTRNVFAAVCAAFLSTGASAQFVNGNFETGDLSGWTVAFTSGGATAVQDAQQFDIDGPGPLGTTWAARFSAGRATGVTTGNHGVLVTQQVSLVAGNTYTIDADWSAWRPAGQGANSNGGFFDLIVNGVSIASATAGSTSGAAPKYGHLTGVFTATSTGLHDIGMSITRQFTIPTPATPTLFQFVDNFTIIPTPGAAALFALAGLAGVRRRR